MCAVGSGNVRVSGDLVLNGDVFSIAWRPNGESIAYQADQNTDNVLELFVSSADGADNERVSGPLVAGGDVQFEPWCGNHRV